MQECLNVPHYKRRQKAFVQTSPGTDRWFVWCFLSTIVGWNIAMLVVGTFDVNSPLNILMDIVGNLSQIVSQDIALKSIQRHI